MAKKVLMLGWEFPPHISGGLGTACHGLTRALDSAGTDVIFVLPRPPAPAAGDAQQPAAPGSPATEQFDHVIFRTVTATLDPYAAAETRTIRETATAGNAVPTAAGGGGFDTVASRLNFDVFHEVQRYAEQALEIADGETFDVIHAHDWMTYPAAMAVAAVTGRPIVAHVHSTEFDRAGESADGRICDIEYRGLAAADRVIAVSRMTRNTIADRYQIAREKIDVVYNAAETTRGGAVKIDRYSLSHGEKIVLFLGRMTQQKGPEFFLLAARKVLQIMPDVKFIMAGTGDMAASIVQLATDMGIGHRVLFTGFLQGLDVERIYRIADLYVMPSVSEPFGIAPLEALANDVPVIISRQSGVGEVLPNSLKVDFWDTPEMANKIVAVLRHEPLATMLRQGGQGDIAKLSWDAAAKSCIEIYENLSA